MSDEIKPPEGANDQTQQSADQAAAQPPAKQEPAPAGKKRQAAASSTGGAVRVRCTLENCGDVINGVPFSLVRDPKGKTAPYMLSDEITQEQADSFLAIPGYTIDE